MEERSEKHIAISHNKRINIDFMLCLYTKQSRETRSSQLSPTSPVCLISLLSPNIIFKSFYMCTYEYFFHHLRKQISEESEEEKLFCRQFVVRSSAATGGWFSSSLRAPSGDPVSLLVYAIVDSLTLLVGGVMVHKILRSSFIKREEIELIMQHTIYFR